MMYMEYLDVASAKRSEAPTRRVARAVVYDETPDGYRFLLLKNRDGYWQNPQGRIGPGESDLEAALRETRQETALDGLTSLPWSEYHTSYFTEDEENPLHTELTGYAVRADSSRPVALSIDGKHTDYEWVDMWEAKSRLTRFPQQREVFDYVLMDAGICDYSY